MGDSAGKPRSLDPSAKEFHPTPLPHLNPIFIAPITFFPPPPHLFLQPYPPMYPPPPPPTYIHPIQPPLPPISDFVVQVETSSLQPSTPLPASTGSPSRSLLLSSLPPHVTEETVRAGMEVFGEVRAVEMEEAHEGVVTVHFYDLRDSEAALREIRAQYMHQQSRISAHYDGVLMTLDSASHLPTSFRSPGLIDGCAFWARFVAPSFLDRFADGHNHGTIVIFNLDSNISAEALKNIFESFGPVKEVRGAPLKRHQKFLEFFDVRHSLKAAREMNGRMIHGRQITIDFSRPGGHGRRWSKHFTSQKPQRNVCTTPQNTIFPIAINAVADSPPSRPNRAPQPTKSTTASSNDDSDGGGGSTVAAKKSTCVNRKNGAVFSRRDAADDRMFFRMSKIRPSKNRIKRFDSRFVVNEDVIRDCGDTRTTLMIKNIPNKYSQKLFLSLLDNHCAYSNDQILAGKGGDHACLSSYDFVYLPIDFNNKCNVGYGFVNMTSPEATMRLYKAFHRQSWEVFNSRKICEVTYARVQALKEHFRNSKFPSRSDEIFPVVFDPPRDGRRQLTPPQPVYGSTDEQSSESRIEADEVLTCVRVSAVGFGENGGGEMTEIDDRVEEVKQ